MDANDPQRILQSSALLPESPLRTGSQEGSAALPKRRQPIGGFLGPLLDNEFLPLPVAAFRKFAEHAVPCRRPHLAPYTRLGR
jgi:hypothetical protein